MNNTFNPALSAGAAVAAPSNKPLWAIVGVLSVAVLAMGGVLVNMKSRPAEPVVAVASPVAAVPMAPLDAPASVLEGKPAKVSAESKSVATKSVAKPVAAKTAPAPAGSGQAPVVVGGGVSQPVVVQAPPPKPVCGNCGTVETVTPVQRQGQANGVGAVAGGVVGAVLGNQVGQGNGKTLATILGGVAGGVAGNAIEKNVKKETVYSVRVHMEDGSVRTLEQATPPAVGAKVTVDGNVLRSPEGLVLSGPPQVAPPRPAQPRPDSGTSGG